MADSSPVPEGMSEEADYPVGEGGEESEKDEGGLTEAQREVLERCLHALKHAKNDSHTLAALLLITRLCPASQLDKPTLRRIFEAVGLNLPARLLVSAVKGSHNSALPPHELLSLGTALLSALSTDPDMASHPQLLTTVPILLEIVANGPSTGAAEERTEESGHGDDGDGDDDHDEDDVEAVSTIRTETTKGPGEGVGAEKSKETSSKLDEAMAADCYQVLSAVCALPKGPDQLLSRGAVPALCLAVLQNQTFSQKRGLTLLSCLLSGKTKDKAWSKHSSELLSLLVKLSKDFSQSKDLSRLEMCSQLVKFLPPAGMAGDSEELKGVVKQLWAVLRPLMQAKLTPRQIGSILVLSACLLDIYGWELVGPPKFCCLLVNRACVEVRMGLEEPPGSSLSSELQDTLTGCYRIMEAAIEQACSPSVAPAESQSSVSALSLQQSRQVLGVLEEAFSAVMFFLQQVDPSRYGDPFVFATFRSLCSWLAEETSCLKEEVTALLPFLVGYSRSHLHGAPSEQGLTEWMAEMAVSDRGGSWSNKEVLRYLLPALCHLSAEEGPRKVLLTLDTPSLIVDFLSHGWKELKGKGGAPTVRDPAMETASSVLLNFTVTEPERVRKDPSFRTLEALLSEAFPVLVHKPGLLVLAANFCTLGLMMGRLRVTTAVDPGQRRFFSTALQFLTSALDSGSTPGPAQVSSAWEKSWDEVVELWRLSLQALGGCVQAQPWLVPLIREEDWLAHVLAMLTRCSRLPDQHTLEALEEALCALAGRCPACKRDIEEAVKSNKEGALNCMKNLRKMAGGK